MDEVLQPFVQVINYELSQAIGLSGCWIFIHMYLSNNFAECLNDVFMYIK